MQDKQGKGRLPAGSPGISRIRFVKANGRAERLTAVRVRKMTAQPALSGGQNLAYRTWSALLLPMPFSFPLFGENIRNLSRSGGSLGLHGRFKCVESVT